jgi:hypothetical protein
MFVSSQIGKLEAIVILFVQFYPIYTPGKSIAALGLQLNIFY